MSDPQNARAESSPKCAWNKGQLVGAKPPLQPKHIWAIRTRLQFDGRLRNLALSNLAADSKLRACDLVRLRIEDVAPHGYAIQRATVQQRKIGRPVRFEITEQSRDAVDTYLASAKRKGGQ
jgi:integrase